ncbi:MAG: hypothetical protein J5J06_19390 [Phycisphaerae bacterium]|nr:hypothetical protein [Phycisphaerae bacterium]
MKAKVPPPPDVFACLEHLADEYKSMPYDDLDRLAEQHAADGSELHRDVNFQGQTYDAHIQFGQLGLPLPRRIGVEIVVWGEGGGNWTTTPCIYFERHASGRIRDFRGEKWKLYAMMLLAVIAAISAMVTKLVGFW